MGYFSQLSITLEEQAARRSEPKEGPRDRLLDRILDLTDRLEELKKPAGRQAGVYGVIPDRALSDPILRYVLPEDLLSYDEVCAALALAEDDLREMDHRDILSVTVLIPGQLFLRSVIGRCGCASI